MPGRNFTDEQEREIALEYLDGKSARQIAREKGLSHHISIVSALKRQGITQRSPSERNRLYKLNPHVFDVIDNELAAYWWGFLYADGCIGRGKTLVVALKSSDKSHLYSLRDFLQSTSPIHDEIRKKKYLASRIEFTDRHLARTLHSLGVSSGRDLFTSFSGIPKHLVSHWTRGLFDGDGSARKSKSLAFCGRPQMLEWLRLQLSINCLTNPNLSISKHSKANLHYLYISGRKQALNVADFMYTDATVWLARKRAIIDSWR